MPTLRLCAAVLLVLSFALAAPARAREFVNHSVTLDTPVSRTDCLPLTLDTRSSLTLHTTISLTRGRIDIQLLDPAGKSLTTFGAQQLSGTPYSRTLDPGTYTLQVRIQDAAGTWSIRADDAPPPRTSTLTLLHFLPGILIFAVVLAGILFWRHTFPERWRWFWAGALLWFIAVVIKGLSFVGPLLDLLKQHLPTPAYIAVGSAWVGLLTGITEVVIVLLAALWLRKLAATPARAVAIGAGAGIVEAFLLGFAAILVPIIFAARSMEIPAITLASTAVPAAERILTIPCHIASRVLVLYAVATGRWRWFWAGFLLLSAVDTVAGYYHISGIIPTTNPWLLELGILPIALASLLLIPALLRHWPASATAPVRQEERDAKSLLFRE